LRRKSETGNRVLEFILTMRAWDKEMGKFMRCDYSPENKRLAEKVEKKGLKVNFEFTAPCTPEENGKVERTYATLCGSAKAVFNNANLTAELRSGLWTECMPQ
jgi:hypothetical protein